MLGKPLKAQHLKRYREIVSVLVRYGRGELVDVLELGRKVNAAIRRHASEVMQHKLWPWVRPARILASFAEVRPRAGRRGARS